MTHDDVPSILAELFVLEYKDKNFCRSIKEMGGWAISHDDGKSWERSNSKEVMLRMFSIAEKHYLLWKDSYTENDFMLRANHGKALDIAALSMEATVLELGLDHLYGHGRPLYCSDLDVGGYLRSLARRSKE